MALKTPFLNKVPPSFWMRCVILLILKYVSTPITTSKINNLESYYLPRDDHTIHKLEIKIFTYMSHLIAFDL